RLKGPLVVKADGLAAGKGVVVCDDQAQARAAVEGAMARRVFGEAGKRVVIEERLEGEELSILAFCDGKTILAMPPAQDFKRANDGDRGPNTGGMGSHSPVPACTEAVFGEVLDEILEPVAAALAEEAEPYTGVIYAGIMLSEDGPKVLEFNCRFGDPETQTLLPRLDGDLAEVIVASTQGALAGVGLRWRDEACVAVVAASEGYPGPCRTGLPISGLGEAASLSGLPVFHAGTTLDAGGTLRTSGGRVATVSALGADHAEASRRAYGAIRKISFEGIWYRSDIGARICGGGPARSRL
ncbi:MAG: phosphoribosylamine--glycine ligase, partial [Actinomycetota bacterium]